MKVYVAITTFQGCIDEVELFQNEEDVYTFAEDWETRNDITDDDTREHESGQGTEVTVHVKEL